MSRRLRERGSVAVEAAIVLPLVLFLLLGALQLHLLHQGQLLARYAAFRAARAGALHGADVGAMEAAALAALVPVTATPDGPVAVIRPVEDGAGYGRRLRELARGIDGLPVVEVTVCGPLRGDLAGELVEAAPDGRTERRPVATAGEVDFDDPLRTTDAWDRWNEPASGDEATARWLRGKLRVQVTVHHVMTVPFAADVIHAAWRGRALASVLGLGRGGNERDGGASEHPAIGPLARRGIFVLPIRAEASMRMQSNLVLANLPARNRCRSWANPEGR